MAVLLIGGRHAARAGVGVWTGGGGSIAAVAVDPTTPSTIYVVSLNSVFKSTDAGSTWVRKNLPPGLGGVKTLAIDPAHPATIYAATFFGGVSKSTDAGETWAAANTGLPSHGLSSLLPIAALAIDPTVSTTVYVATSFGELFKSIDGGAHWREADAGLGSRNFSITTLAIDPTRPATIYAGTGSGGVFKSTDAAGTWASIDTGLPSDFAAIPPIAVLAIDPANPATVYAASVFGTSGGAVFKSIDGGAHWAEADTGLPHLDVTALVIDPTRPDTVYVGVTGLGVFETTDGGSSWIALGTGLTNTDVHVQTLTIAVDPADGATLYAGTREGLFDLEREARSPTPAVPCSSARCTLDAGLMDRMCLGESIPRGVTRRFDHAVQLIDGAATSSGRRARTLLKRAAKILDRAGRRASRDVPGRRRPRSSAAPPAISVGCAATLKAAAEHVSDGLGV